ncbi:MAG: acyl CoA:acetate/3-ketoacid CoA transferase [Clostridiales bacterium]|nr:acyl CoA:acetate/3-ketoacid CoA transferase [Clostridiales bacterium]
MSKIVTAAEAISKIPDGAFVAIAGVGGNGIPSESVAALAERYEKEQHPKGISVMCSGGNPAPNSLTKEGLMGGYYSGLPGLDTDLIKSNAFPAYALTQGIAVQLYRAQANDSPFLTKAGVNTFLDPRIEASALNDNAAGKPIVELLTIGGQEYLHYDLPPVTVALIRGTTADTDGNLTNEEELIKHEILYMAMAAHNNGGIVIAQVKHIAPLGSLNAAMIKVPGMLVDYVIPCSDVPKWHTPDMTKVYSAGQTGYAKVDDSFVPLHTYKPDGDRLIVARRATEELKPGLVCNVGIGMPAGIAYVVSTEGIFNDFYLSNELGAIGGHIGNGMFFATAFNARAYMNHHEMFDFINGHGLDITFLGAAEVDEDGSVNVTRIAGKIRGSGGFINIASSTRKVVFLSSFTVGGDSTGDNGSLKILEQGKPGKFLKKVDQISFNGKDAERRGQEIMYVTERAVFKLIKGKVTLIEIAEGMDLQKDILDFMEFKPEIAPDLKKMSRFCFSTDPIGLKEQWSKLI